MVPQDEGEFGRTQSALARQLLSGRYRKKAKCSALPKQDKLAASRPRPFGGMGRKDQRAGQKRLGMFEEKRRCFPATNWRRRQWQRAFTPSKTLKQILGPGWAEDAKETLALMGDDTPSAVLSNQYARSGATSSARTLSQVTNRRCR